MAHELKYNLGFDDFVVCISIELARSRDMLIRRIDLRKARSDRKSFYRTGAIQLYIALFKGHTPN